MLEELKLQHDSQVKNRQTNNRKILKYLSDYIEKHPELRFIQILWNLNIVDNTDRYAEEPDITIKHILNQERIDSYE